MNDATKAAIIAAATIRATKLCADANATLAAGRKVYVKGKATIVAWDDDKRREMKRLQLTAFDATMSTHERLCSAVEPFVAAEGITEATEDAFVQEALDLYMATGRAEVERLMP